MAKFQALSLRNVVPCVLVCLLALVHGNVWAETTGAKNTSRAELVTQFQVAFNHHDADAMAELVTKDIVWYGIDGTKLTKDLSGRSALRTAMNDYFQNCPSCRSQIGDIIASKDRASVVETAYWENDNGPQSQQSIAVYEFTGSLIKAIYYFPSEAN